MYRWWSSLGTTEFHSWWEWTWGHQLRKWVSYFWTTTFWSGTPSRSLTRMGWEISCVFLEKSHSTEFEMLLLITGRVLLITDAVTDVWVFPVWNNGLHFGHVKEKMIRASFPSRDTFWLRSRWNMKLGGQVIRRLTSNSGLFRSSQIPRPPRESNESLSR